jgi:hypothetical protein
MADRKITALGTSNVAGIARMLGRSLLAVNPESAAYPRYPHSRGSARKADREPSSTVVDVKGGYLVTLDRHVLDRHVLDRLARPAQRHRGREND